MRKICFLMIAGTLVYTGLQAQLPKMNVPGRHTTSLNGNWHYIVDPYESGYMGFHGEVYDQTNSGSHAAYYNNYQAKNKQELVEYNFDKSPVLKVPGDWNTQDSKLFYYEGTVWYKKSFDYPVKPDRRLFLYFGAVNYKADVYLNGQKLGTHEGGFTPFQFEITGIAKVTGNYIVVKADNKRTKEGVPAMSTDWWNYGGITRDVLLIEEPENFISDYTFQLKRGSHDLIRAVVQLDEPKDGQEISISIPELAIKNQTKTDDAGRAVFEFHANWDSVKIKYWTPASPKRYRVEISSPLETITDQIGFRTIETKGSDILLNGKSVFLRGISIHEEYKGRRANSYADALALLSAAKELGCNYVRLAHYPHNENMLRVADSIGLLVWEEVPVYWSIAFTNPDVLKNVKQQLSAVINRDKNRACTIIWSVANETPQTPGRNEFLQELAAYVRSMDSTRLVSAALLTRMEKDVNIVDDKIAEAFDVVAFNEYRGWYGGDLATAPDAVWKIAFNKPVIISEFGGDAKQGLHGTKEERWTEEFQEYLYRQNISMLLGIPALRGMSPWILMDFRSPRRQLPGVQDGFNRKGLISDQGKKKKAFAVLSEFYQIIKLRYP